MIGRYQNAKCFLRLENGQNEVRKGGLRILRIMITTMVER